jgi:hypothetical protein
MIRDLGYYALLLLESVVGVLGIRLYEEPRYDVLAELPGGVEVRRYAPRLAAEVALPGVNGEARDEAFRRLFRYIAGANDGAGKIAMTVPVATESRGEKIAMTTPVGTLAAQGVVRMRFFLPASISPDRAPKPTDPLVRLVQLPEETAAALRFSGRGGGRRQRGRAQRRTPARARRGALARRRRAWSALLRRALHRPVPAPERGRGPGRAPLKP